MRRSITAYKIDSLMNDEKLILEEIFGDTASVREIFLADSEDRGRPYVLRIEFPDVEIDNGVSSVPYREAVLSIDSRRIEEGNVFINRYRLLNGEIIERWSQTIHIPSSRDRDPYIIHRTGDQPESPLPGRASPTVLAVRELGKIIADLADQNGLEAPQRKALSRISQIDGQADRNL